MSIENTNDDDFERQIKIKSRELFNMLANIMETGTAEAGADITHDSKYTPITISSTIVQDAADKQRDFAALEGTPVGDKEIFR